MSKAHDKPNSLHASESTDNEGKLLQSKMQHRYSFNTSPLVQDGAFVTQAEPNISNQDYHETNFLRIAFSLSGSHWTVSGMSSLALGTALLSQEFKVMGDLACDSEVPV